MTEIKRAFYFVMQSPDNGGSEEDEWFVFAVRSDQQKWWHLVARFTEKCRADLYADVENNSQVTDVDSVPSNLSIPSSALGKIITAAKAGNIFAHEPPVAADSNGSGIVDLGIMPKDTTSFPRDAVGHDEHGHELRITPHPKPAKIKKKPNAHFPSDKWHGRSVERLTELRAEGKSFSEIAKILNEEFHARGYTPAACSGKADRLRLPKPNISPEPADQELPATIIQAQIDDPLEDDSFPLADVMGIIEEANKPEILQGLEELPTEIIPQLPGHASAPPTTEQVNEAIRWYRSFAHAVYKMKDGTIQVDHGEFLPQAEFLALVNQDRERLSLQPFGQEAAD